MVLADGTFTVSVPADLADGDHTVTASVEDAAGNTGSATDEGDGGPDRADRHGQRAGADQRPDADAVRHQRPAGRVDRVAVRGRADLHYDGPCRGTFTISVPADLADGDHTVTASVIDAAANTGTATDNLTVDRTAPTVTVSAPALDERPDADVDRHQRPAGGSTVRLSVGGQSFTRWSSPTGRSPSPCRPTWPTATTP
jgi:hypothetical protein